MHVGDVIAEVVTMLVVIGGSIVLADRLLWRRYWHKHGFEWSNERQALVKMGKVTKRDE